MANKTAILQANDICPFFEVVKASGRNNTPEHVPASGLKDRLEVQLDKLTLSGALTVDLQQKRALLDHLVTAPEIFTRGMGRENIAEGFVKNGVVDIPESEEPSPLNLSFLSVGEE